MGRVQSLSPALTLGTALLAEEIKDINVRTDRFENRPLALRVVF